MLGAVVAEIQHLTFLRPRAHVDPTVSAHEPGGAEVGSRGPASGAMSVRRSREPAGSPDGHDDGHEDGRVARHGDEPRPLPPDLLRPPNVSEAPPPEEEVERRVERTDAQGEEPGG